MESVDEPLFFCPSSLIRQSEVAQIFQKSVQKYRDMIENGYNQHPCLVVGSGRIKINRDRPNVFAPFPCSVIVWEASCEAIKLLLGKYTIFIFAQTVSLIVFFWLFDAHCRWCVLGFVVRSERDGVGDDKKGCKTDEKHGQKTGTKRMMFAPVFPGITSTGVVRTCRLRIIKSLF